MLDKSNISLNKDWFKKSRHRQLQERGYFFRFESAINFLRVVVALFMAAPVLVVTNILSKATVLIILNITLALCTLSTHIYKYCSGARSILELFIITIGTGAVAAILLTLTPSISIATQFSFWLFKINIFAYAVNGFDLIKDLVISLFKTFCEKVLNVKLDVYSKKELTLEKSHATGKDDSDIYIIKLLLAKCYGIPASQVIDKTDPEIKNKLEQLNKSPTLFIKSINTMYSSFMGFIFKKSRIEKLKAMIEEFFDGEPDSLIKMINDKIVHKQTKVSLMEHELKYLETLITEASTPEEQKTVGFDIKLCSMFNNFKYNQTSYTEAEQTEQIKQCKAVLEAELKHQRNKLDILESCVPDKMKLPK